MDCTHARSYQVEVLCKDPKPQNTKRSASMSTLCICTCGEGEGEGEGEREERREATRQTNRHT